MVENAFYILLADAHTCSRIGLYQILTDAGFYVIAEMVCPNELETLMQAHHPHLLLLTSNWLPTSPTIFLSNLIHGYPETTVVLLLDNNNDLPLRELAAIGITSMVLKTESSNVIVQAVRAAAAGSGAFSPELLDRMTSRPDTPTADTRNISLTALEQQLLQLLCAGKSNPEIARTLNLSRKTIEKHLTALYKKLGVKTRTGAAVWRLQRGK